MSLFRQPNDVRTALEDTEKLQLIVEDLMLELNSGMGHVLSSTAGFVEIPLKLSLPNDCNGFYKLLRDDEAEEQGRIVAQLQIKVTIEQSDFLTVPEAATGVGENTTTCQG